MKSLYIFILVVAAVGAKSIGFEGDDVTGSVYNLVNDCQGDIALCLKERALKYVETLALPRELNITDGITLLGTGSPRSARALEPLSEEPRARESQIENRIVDMVTDFAENHVIQLRMPKSTVEDMKRSIEEGRGKKKKLKQLLPILALIKLKIGALIPLFLGIIAFAAVKALLLGKLALLASGLLLLKKLISSKSEHHESYEVVAHPHHEEHYSSSHGGHGGGGGGGGWGRSADDAQDLAYNGYATN